MASYEDKQEKVKELTQKLEEGIKDLFESDKFKNYLRTMSKFHNYSYGNIFLILSQKPEATHVAGFNAWKNNFKRFVQKGEKGIQIIAPSPYRIKEEQEKVDEKTGKQILDKEGKPIKEIIEVEKMSFRIAYVFDVSQTEGEPLPELVSLLNNNVNDYEKLLECLKTVSPFPVYFEQMERMNGYCSPKERKIAVKEGLSEAQTIKTLIHEISHADLHTPELTASLEVKDRQTKEVEAESVACIVCNYLGIDTSDYSFGYIASWSSKMELPELKSSLQTIQKQAADLIDRINEKYQELQKQPVQQMPDPTVSIKEMEKYGYQYSNVNMLPLKHEKALELFDNNKEVYILKTDNTESIAKDKYELSKHLENGGIAGIKLEEWNVKKEIKETISQSTLLDKVANGFTKNEFENKIFKDIIFPHSSIYANKSFENSEFNNCTFIGTNFQECNFKKSVFKSCSFDDINFYRADLSYAAIDGCKINDAHMDASNLNQAVLKDSEFEKVCIRKMTLEYATLDNTKFRNVEQPTLLNLDNLRYIPPKSMSADIYKRHIENILTPQPNVTYTVWQLKDSPENRNRRFTSYEELTEKGEQPDLNNYQKVYTGKMFENTHLESIYTTLNINKPENYKARSMSVSDIIIITEKQDKYTAHYVDSFGFKECPNIAEQYQQQKQRQNTLTNNNELELYK